MSVTLWLALLLQLCSVALLRIFLGKTWLRRPGTLLVLASVVYDGLSQVLLSFPSIGAWDIYRNGIQPGFIAEADLLMSAGMLVFTVAYLVTCGPRREAPAAPEDAALAAKVLDWRILAAACLPLALLTYEGRGYNGTIGATASPSLASAFFVLAASLASVAFLLRHGMRWFLPVLAVQTALLAAAGERTPVIACAIALAIVPARAGMRPRRAHMTAAVALTVVAVFAIAGVRAEQGRSLFTQNTGLQERLAALGGGVASGSQAASPGLAGQMASRLDGVSFAAGILQARAMGSPLLAPSAVPESLLLAVPKALWPGKPDQGNALDPYEASLDDFGMQQINFLPTLPGLYAGFLATPWLLAFMALAGAAWGLAERWVLARGSAARIVMLAGAVQAALCYEAGLAAMLTALRSAAVIAAAAWLAGAWRQGRARQAKCVIISANPLPPFPPAPDVPVPEAI